MASVEQRLAALEAAANPPRALNYKIVILDKDDEPEHDEPGCFFVRFVSPAKRPADGVPD